MSKYVRKTRTVFDIEQYTASGWECVNTETTRRDALQSVREYRQNQPEYAARIKPRQERITP